MDAFVGNPPFAGKNAIIEAGGESYLPWLQTIHRGAHGNADVCAHFFLRAEALLGGHGAIGFVATNTIAQGDTRTTGLRAILERGAVIYEATRSIPWPGDAAVSVALVHLAKGRPAGAIPEFRLDAERAPRISSRLRGRPERPDPRPLAENTGCSFVGTYVLGMGFTLTPEDRARLVATNPRNGERISPYIGGEEVNTEPTQTFGRYVIRFGQVPLEEAEQWEDLLAIVRAKVKPGRDQLKDNTDGRHRKEHWWQFGRETPALAAAVAPLERCLVTSIHSKHLMFSFQPSDRVFSHALSVIALDTLSAFAILQSRVHEPWARLLSSSLEDRLRYTASDCFETFPFPQPDPREVLPLLEDAGGQLYNARARAMLEGGAGLTLTYNRLKSAACDDPTIIELRRLHEEMDAAVLRAYGWGDLAVPPYCPINDNDRRAIAAFEDEIVDRLFVLNARRAGGARPLRGPSRG
jgi:hypothetical protein